MDYRILKDYPYKNAYGQYAYSSSPEFYLNTGINSKEFDDDLYVIRENILVDDQPYNVDTDFLYSPFYNIVVNQNTSGVVSTNDCPSGFYFINQFIDEDFFDSDIHCCIDMQEFAKRRILLEFNIADNNINTQIYYDKNSDNYKNSTAPNEVLVKADVVLNDNFLPFVEEINSYALSTIYIAEWGDEASTKDKETLISDFQNNKFQFEKSGITTGLKHFYQTPGVHKIKGFTEIKTGNTGQCPYVSGGDDEIETYLEIKNICDSNQDCLGYKVSIIGDWIYVWYGTEIPTTSYWVYGSVTSIISDTTNAIIAKEIGEVSEGEGIAQIVDDVVVDYCLRFGSTGDMNYEPWSMYESFTTTDYFEAKINLNVDEVFKDEFEEIGGTGFDYLPWPETSPIIGGLSDESKYINDVINIVNQNQFKETELLDKQKAEEALQNDELGNHLGKIDLAQTRFFKGVYDMDQLLMVESMMGKNLFDETPFNLHSDSEPEPTLEVNYNGGYDNITFTVPETGIGAFSGAGSVLHYPNGDPVYVDHTKTYKVEATVEVHNNSSSSSYIRIYLGATGGGWPESPNVAQISELGTHQISGFVNPNNYDDTQQNIDMHSQYMLEFATATDDFYASASWTISNISVREVLTDIDDSTYTPYDNFDYWDGETEETTFSDESCVGLIFINDSTNSILRDNCILEFNFGDSQDDIVIDTSGQNNKGIIIGDYSLQKTSKDIPLIKDDVMITPTTDSTDGAF